MKGVTGLDDTSIQNACQLVGYDCVVRAGIHAYSPVQSIHADAGTIANIRIMVERSMAFWEEYGPIVLNGFTIRNNRIIDDYLDNGKVIEANDRYVLTVDIPFKSPSAPADLITGGSTNGWDFFKGLNDLRKLEETADSLSAQEGER